MCAARPQYDATTGRQLFRWSHAILNFCPLDTLRADTAGFIRDDVLSLSVTLAPHRPPVKAKPSRAARKRVLTCAEPPCETAECGKHSGRRLDPWGDPLEKRGKSVLEEQDSD